MSRVPDINHRLTVDNSVDLILPDPPGLFKRRAARFYSLAHGNATREYLKAMAQMADAQAAASTLFPPTGAMPSIPELPLDPCHHTYGEAWQKVLDFILSEMERAQLPKRLNVAISRLRSMPPAGRQFLAQAIVCWNDEAIDPGVSPFLSAALQVYWSDLAARSAAQTTECGKNLCPVCGFAPVAGIIEGESGSRYLCCSLCATRWSLARSMCSHCLSAGTLFYFAVDEDDNGSKVETCGHCNTYLKLFSLDRNPDVDAFADDLAAISLDLLMSDKPYHRGGINLFHLPGEQHKP